MKTSLRKTNFSDIEFLWYLRNQPNVYKFSKDRRPVKWKEHVSWIIPILLGKTSKDLFLIQQGSLPVGQIRFTYGDNKTAKISIAILKKFRGKGMGKEALKKAISLLKRKRKVKILIADLRENNLPSKKLFEKLNFKLKKKKREWLKYVLNL